MPPRFCEGTGFQDAPRSDKATGEKETACSDISVETKEAAPTDGSAGTKEAVPTDGSAVAKEAVRPDDGSVETKEAVRPDDAAKAKGGVPVITVRDAEEGDLSSLLAMEAECFRTPYREGALRPMLSQSFAKNYLALSGGEAVGYLLATTIAGESEILRIAVQKEMRGRGIARALLSRLLEDLSEDTAYFLEVRRSNTAAIALYSAFGFDAYAERKNYYKDPTEDAVLMRRLPKEEMK